MASACKSLAEVLTLAGIEAHFQDVLVDACSGQPDYLADVEPEDLVGQQAANGVTIRPAVARGLVRKLQRFRSSGVPENVNDQDKGKVEQKHKAEEESKATPVQRFQTKTTQTAEDDQRSSSSQCGAARAVQASVEKTAAGPCGACDGKGCSLCKFKRGTRVQLVEGRHAGQHGTVTREPDIMRTLAVRLESGEDLSFVPLANCRSLALPVLLAEMDIELRFHRLLSELCNHSPRQLGCIEARNLIGQSDPDGGRIEECVANRIILKLRLGPPSKPLKGSSSAPTGGDCLIRLADPEHRSQSSAMELRLV